MEKKIFITRDKIGMIKTLTKQGLMNIKVYSETEFLKIFPYIYTKQTLDYLMNKYHILLEVAQKYLENICTIELECCKNPKCLFLKTLKNELIENKLLIKNEMLAKRLKEATIFVDDAYMSFPLLRILKDYTIHYYHNYKTEFTPQIYCLNNIEDEVAFTFEKIASLIRKGISIEHIYLTNVPAEYEQTIKRISEQTHIPVTDLKRTSLAKTTLGTLFIQNIDLGITEALEELKKKLTSIEDENLYNQIVQCINEHLTLKNRNVFILDSLKKKKVQNNKLTSVIQIVDYRQHFFKSDDYVFFLSFNSSTIPLSYKDEEYINDQTRALLNIDTSKDRNKREKEYIHKLIMSIKHCTITYKLHTLTKECYPSSLLENFHIESPLLNYNLSDSYNCYALAKYYDDYTKYGSISASFLKLANQYSIPYHTYSNQYKPIADAKILELFKKKLVLSYSKMNSYIACPFSFYLKYILKLSPYEETFSIKVGNIFHKILERMNEDEFDYDYVFKTLIKDEEFNAKELFLLNHLKEEFRFTLNLLNERRKVTELCDGEFEKEEKISIPAIVPVTFEGKIDLIRYNTERTVFQLVDYKTGVPYLDASIMPLGFSLQLPTYLYLLKHDSEFINMKCGGFYLQPIFVSKQKEDPKVDYDVILKKAFKAVGYSNSNQDILGICDFTYPDSVQIKSLKTKSDGNFYHYSKIFDESDLRQMYQLVETFIKQSLQGILSGDFRIQAKILDNKTNLSCTYCPFQDICFHTPKDQVYVNSDEHFLKKEVEHGLDE